MKKTKLECFWSCGKSFEAEFSYIITCPHCEFTALWEKFIEMGE